MASLGGREAPIVRRERSGGWRACAWVSACNAVQRNPTVKKKKKGSTTATFYCCFFLFLFLFFTHQRNNTTLCCVSLLSACTLMGLTSILKLDNYFLHLHACSLHLHIRSKITILPFFHLFHWVPYFSLLSPSKFHLQLLPPHHFRVTYSFHLQHNRQSIFSELFFKSEILLKLSNSSFGTISHLW